MKPKLAAVVASGVAAADGEVREGCGAVIPGMGSSRDRTQGYVKVLRHPRYDDRAMCWGYGAILSHLAIPM